MLAPPYAQALLSDRLRGKFLRIFASSLGSQDKPPRSAAVVPAQISEGALPSPLHLAICPPCLQEWPETVPAATQTWQNCLMAAL